MKTTFIGASKREKAFGEAGKINCDLVCVDAVSKNNSDAVDAEKPQFRAAGLE